MKRRTRAREAALRVLYQIELTLDPPEEVLENFWHESSLRAEVRAFAEQLVHGVIQQRAILDRVINDVSTRWSVERMPIVDRNILRIAVFELMFLADIPPKVSINEAIELAKVYGAKESPAFINGILDPVSKDLPRACAGETQ